MDEAYRIGTGRYRWFVNEELVDTVELFIRHLKKVLAMAENMVLQCLKFGMIIFSE